MSQRAIGGQQTEMRACRYYQTKPTRRTTRYIRFEDLGRSQQGKRGTLFRQPQISHPPVIYALHKSPPTLTTLLKASSDSLGASMRIGEEWAYRAKQRDPLVQVQIRRIGTKRPPRGLIRFIEDEHEGREEWGSPAGLKTTWDKAE